MNSRRTDVQFKIGDWVLLKLQPYRQESLARRSFHKLARHFYGPFQISERLGAVAYRLILPPTAKLHSVFHVSKLKRFVGDPNIASGFLPEEFLHQHPLRVPESIVTNRRVLKHR